MGRYFLGVGMSGRMTIAQLVREILPDAIEQVSDGGRNVFSARSLFYAVRQLFLTRFYVCPECGGEPRLHEPPDIFSCLSCGVVFEWTELRPKYPNLRFYKSYNSFTQDFLRSYEMKHGKIPNLYREERGEYTYPDEEGYSEKVIIGGRERTRFIAGCGNKIIVVEKSGIYGTLVENDFHKRLDAVILSTEGFSIEQARLLLKVAEERDYPVCVLHDFDINGILIKETLVRPTKRLPIKLEKVIDLGLNWEIVNRLMRERGLIPEPVELRLADIAKLEGMLERGEIAEEEYRFLIGRTNERYDAWRRGERVGSKEVLAVGFRVEIQALRPSELIEWLEGRLRELDLWKTIPSEDELVEYLTKIMKNEMYWFIDHLEDKLSDLISDITDEVERLLGLDVIWDALYSMRKSIKSKVEEMVKDEVSVPSHDEIDYPEMDLDEFVELLEEEADKFWKKVASSKAKELVEDVKKEIREEFEENIEEVDEEEVAEDVKEDEEIQDKLREFREVLLEWEEE